MTSHEKMVLREELYGMLGDLPPKDQTVFCRILNIKEYDHYILEHLVLEIEEDSSQKVKCEPIPAYFVRPKIGENFPVVLFNHSHGGRYDLGKEELFNPPEYMHSPCYADVLIERGIAVLCIDHWCFGERKGCSEQSVFKRMLWDGETLWGHMVYDSLKAMDYLCSRSDVDKQRIGTIGMSMGSTMAWWIAALDERIKMCIDVCCLTDFDELVRCNNLDRHSIYYFVPGLRKRFTTAQINSLIAPRPHLGTVGIYDKLTPIEGVEKIEREVKRVYEEAGVEEKFIILRYPCAHLETAEMRGDVLRFLDKYL